MNENNMKLITVKNFATILAESVMSKNDEPWNWNDYSFVYYDGIITDDLVFAYRKIEHIWCGIHCIDTGFDSFDPNFITDIYGGGCLNIYSINLDMDKKLIKNEFEKIILNIINETEPIHDVDEDAIVLIEKCIKEDNTMWKTEYWKNDEELYRDLDREDDGTPIEDIGRYEIIFDFDKQRYYCFVDAINLNEALGIFFKNHNTVTYAHILEHMEI